MAMRARPGGLLAAMAAGAALGVGYGLARWFRAHPRADGRYRPRTGPSGRGPVESGPTPLPERGVAAALKRFGRV